MSIVRKVVTVLLTMLLATTLVTANVVAAAHLTILDPNFVSNTVEEQDGYELVQDTTVDTVTDSDMGEQLPAGIDSEELVRESIEEEYLQSQTEKNLHRLYAYLHGNTDTLNLSINTEPLKDNVTDAAEEQIRDASIADLLAETDTELPGPVNESMIRRMSANESEYEAVKSEFRQQFRSRILNEAVDQVYQESSNDEKLALIIPDYDPRDYTEAEKERMVADNETEIRTATRNKIEEERGDEIDDQVDTALAEVNETATANATDEEGPAAAAIGVQSVYVEALTTDMSYDTFQSDLDAAKAELAEAVVAEAEPMIDEEIPSRIDLTAELGPEVTDGLEPVRTAVTVLDYLAIGLPILALLIVGLLYFVTRSTQTVASSTGFSLLSAGLPIYLSLGFISSFVEEQAEAALEEMQADGGMPGLEELMDLMLGIFGQILGRIGAVSLAFVLAGLALLAVWFTLRSGVIGGGDDGSGGATGETGDGRASESAGADEPAADVDGDEDEAEDSTDADEVNDDSDAEDDTDAVDDETVDGSDGGSDADEE